MNKLTDYIENDTFYPTPNNIVRRLLSGIEMDTIEDVLEPSAGSGDIAMHFIPKDQYDNIRKNIRIDCIEINSDLRNVLRGKGLRVIYDDFLTFYTAKRYDLIVMNPPFNKGVDHLLHAIELCVHGGKIRCILNAATIDRCFDIESTGKLKILSNTLKELNANIEYVDNAFKAADKKTNVRIAIIFINIPDDQDEIKSELFERLQKDDSYNVVDNISNENTQVTYSDFVKAIVSHYRFEIELGASLIKEFFATAGKINKEFKPDKYDDAKSLFTLKIGYDEVGGVKLAINALVKAIRSKYWAALFNSESFDKIMTTTIRDKFIDRIKDLCNYDFNVFNIEEIQSEIKRDYSKTIEKTILNLFDMLSRKHNWDDKDSPNVHYYNGWKTNKAWKINHKCIIPMIGMDTYRRWECVRELSDIEKTFNYLSGQSNKDCTLSEILDNAKKNCQTKKIQCKYFKLTFYLKGTCHIEFTDMGLLDKFNIFGSQRENWLPPGFGKKSYNMMNHEEKSVVDNFCGENKYKEFMNKQDYYIVNDVQLLTDNNY